MLYHGFDAAHPPSRAYPGTQVACGYLGPDGFTPHVWSLEEWNLCNEGGVLRSLGIWLADFSATPGGQARAASEAAIALGWKPHAEVLRFITLDSEVSLDVMWIRDFAESLFTLGFLAFDYRSISAQVQSPSGLDEWSARWDVPPGPFSAKQEGFQYEEDVSFDNTLLDLDLFSQLAFDRFGRGVRRVVAA